MDKIQEAAKQEQYNTNSKLNVPDESKLGIEMVTEAGMMKTMQTQMSAADVEGDQQ